MLFLSAGTCPETTIPLYLCIYLPFGGLKIHNGIGLTVQENNQGRCD